MGPKSSKGGGVGGVGQGGERQLSEKNTTFFLAAPQSRIYLFNININEL